MDKQLLEKYFKGQCTPQEAVKVESWLSTADTMLLDEFMMGKWEEANSPVVMKPRVHQFWYGAAAAAIIGIIVSIAFFWQHRTAVRPVAVKWDTLHNTSDNIQLFTMEDGSEVWLNTHSSIIYQNRYNQESRELWLHGEAYFKVTKDEKRPFLVHTGHLTTTVLGTVFNIATSNMADGSIQISLLEGKVAVSKPDSFNEVLLPGQMLNYVNGRQPQLTNFEKNDVLDWKKGKIHFNHTRLADALTRIQQRYGCRIVLDDPLLGKKKISGEFSRDMSLEKILATLGYVHDISFVQINDTTYETHSK
ncbi:ferric-dicitrate binding protein FerR, regulates iron transport through sigma-19 [Chitinophaga eiseniae]|uniref:Ferric-dicitrate binding protein FerR, regulates iron transport through sigma-19 n=1 Tax=Chitinophaga eiseniae TaxID=634771 RepID=A0A1T4R2G1_9BACT|nr:FecR domain-containing protein [Chitinophaga eiseniae]SKA10143.1 ferric-dicitrate binding protein FerR, regulates iron transport through sigma-19 [Chitinophaga eiseniae]